MPAYPSPPTLSHAFLGGLIVTMGCLSWRAPLLPPDILWMALACATLFFVIVQWRLPTLLLGTAVGIGALCGTGAVAYALAAPPSDAISHIADGRPFILRGTIVDAPDRRFFTTYYIIEAHGVRTSASEPEIPARGRVRLVYSHGWPLGSYGDSVEATGELARTEDTETLSATRYMAANGIRTIMRGKEMRVLSSGNGNPVFAVLIAIREHLEATINRLEPEPHAALLAGLLVGSRRGMPDHTMDEVMTTGLTHIIAVSGFNVTMVATAVMAMLFWLPIKWRVFPSLVIIAAFAVVAGGSASVVRAAVMGSLGLMALLAGRKQTMRLSILWTLGILAAINPLRLWYDAGFQLSFLAVVGLVELDGVLTPLFSWMPRTLGIRDQLHATAAAQLTSAPWIALLFGRFSLISPFANLAVAFAIPPAMLLGFLAVLLSFAHPMAGQIVAYGAWAALEWILLAIHWMAQIPYASVELEATDGWVIGAYYAMLLGIVILMDRRQKRHSSRSL